MSFRLLERNRQLAYRYLDFWTQYPFRAVWFVVLRHRYAPEAVWRRYERLSGHRVRQLAMREERYSGRFPA